MRTAGTVLLRLALLVVFLAGLHHIRLWGRNYLFRGQARALLAGTAAGNWLSSLSARPRGFNIDIGFTDQRWLAFNRHEALQRGVLVQHDASWVPARLELPDRTVRVDVRLKGDTVDHIQGDKWSLRVRVKGDDAVFGMKCFSIQDPRCSALLYEWVFHELMRHEGFVAPRYDFVEVYIGGEPRGIYALEESFGKEMLEAQARREGPIIRFDESYLWVPGVPIHRQEETLFAAEVDAFGSKRIDADPVLGRQFHTARDLLEGFRDQRLPLDQVFDVGRMARYFALVDLCSAQHAARWKNIRFYYNPVTSRLEPIPYNAYHLADAAAARVYPVRYLSAQRKYAEFAVPVWMDAFMQDPVFYGAYVRELERVSDPAFLDDFFAEVDADLRQKASIIHREYATFAFSDADFRKNAEMIRHAVRPRIPIRVRLDLERLSAGDPCLRIANNLPLAIEPVAVLDGQEDARHALAPGMTIAAKRTDSLHDVPVVLPGPALAALGAFEDDRFQLAYRVVGLDAVHTAPIRDHAVEPALSFAQRAANAFDRIHEIEAFEFSDENTGIRIRSGTWTFDRTVYVPRGHVLRAGPGVTLNLRNGASLISFSALEFVGTADRPVVIRAEDAAGGGLAVITAERESVLKHVRFEDLNGPVEGTWGLTGAVTFYESPVRMTACRFTHGRAEDQLNIIRSRFALDDSRFERAESDAVDIDFGQGVIRGCTFLDSGNDAIDVSGTQVTVARCEVARAGDKALSGGESSRVAIKDLDIRDCRFGAVSKDLSTITGRGLTVRGGRTALAAYQKKPEYGPASLVLEQVHFERVGEEMLIERGSWAMLDGEETRGLELDVAGTIYGE